MSTCRHCGEEIEIAETKSLFGGSKRIWVHSRSGEGAAHKCMMCQYVGLEKTFGAVCPNCGTPMWSYAVVDHYAEP